jgi:hypothetical protein
MLKWTTMSLALNQRAQLSINVVTGKVPQGDKCTPLVNPSSSSSKQESVRSCLNDYFFEPFSSFSPSNRFRVENSP